MIKFVVTVNKFTNDGFKKIVVEYGEKELNLAITNIWGIVSECLVSKKTVLDTVSLDKIVGNEMVNLIYLNFENYSYRYLINRKE
jgi:hypothetical protein